MVLENDTYPQTFDISCTLVGNNIVDHTDVHRLLWFCVSTLPYNVISLTIIVMSLSEFSIGKIVQPVHFKHFTMIIAIRL